MEQKLSLIEKEIARGHVSIRRAALIIGVAYLSLRKWVQEGKIGSITIGDRQYIPTDELRRFMTEGNLPSPPISLETNLERKQDAAE